MLHSSANTIARQYDGAGQRCGQRGNSLASHTQRRRCCAPRAATGPLQQGLQAQMRRDGRHYRQQSSLRAVSAQAPARAPLAEALPQPAPGFSSIPDALADIAAGKFVVVTDDADRENEGDLIIAAQHMTPEKMHFMVQHTSGYVCVGMTGRELDRLGVPLMVPPPENEEALRTAFTVTVDLRAGTTTGISAADRAATCVALADPVAVGEDFNMPGHILPLRARSGGVLARRGHTEAGVDLARLAGCAPAGVLCEMIDPKDGSMSQTPQLLEFAQRYNLRAITIDDLAHYIQDTQEIGF